MYLCGIKFKQLKLIIIILMETKISKQIIKKFDPCCSDPSNHITDENEELPVMEWIKKYRDVVPARDIVWLILRKEFISEKNLRLFSVWCARDALKLIENIDPRSISACDVAERYANGQATKEELLAANAAADAAYRDASALPRAVNPYSEDDDPELYAYYANPYIDSDHPAVYPYYARLLAINAAIHATDNVGDIDSVADYAADCNAFAVAYATAYAAYASGGKAVNTDDAARATRATQLKQLLTYF
jgi:hypothetical protein